MNQNSIARISCSLTFQQSVNELSYKRWKLHIVFWESKLLVLCRLSKWFFKKGKREEAFSELDRILNSTTRNTQGFRGYISMLSYDDKNAATILTLWHDKESLRTSEKGVFTNAIAKVQDSLEKHPIMENLRVFSTELFQKSEQQLCQNCNPKLRQPFSRTNIKKKKG